MLHCVTEKKKKKKKKKSAILIIVDHLYLDFKDDSAAETK